MTPIKVKDLIEDFCESRGYSKEDIDLIVQECYEEIKLHMTLMEHDFLEVPVFGSFFLKAWTVKRGITRHQQMMSNTKYSAGALKAVQADTEKLQTVYTRMSANFYKRRTSQVYKKNLKKTMKLRETLKLAWENKEHIAEGFYNKYLSHSEEIKNEIERRKTMCEQNQCGYYDKDGKPETSAIPGKPACSLCHCNIDLKTACMSCHCSLKDHDQVPLWEEVISVEMDKHINEIEYKNQFKPKQ